ncbi:solute carrier family 35 member G1-like [Uranotaenia lowii]|uniref:solute carrier family 35 member G1-like n=1 Tax=Uranotaenia lowii TaxID=190385 RepID=UPI00247AF4D8|nr:solute carrier family 35 member G1-like [Uranotaenia lowii]XP_055607779.1 solute carrier family 35 member G1-like [Uranotaenia lowii]
MPEHLELQQLVGGVLQGGVGHRSWIGWLQCSCPYLGIILATVSSLFFSLCSVIVKGLVEVNPIELATFRFIGVLLPSIPIAIYKEESFFPRGKRIILVLRCFVGTTGLMLSFYAFRHMPLADASVIIFSTPVFVAIFARLFLRESCGIFNVITIVLTLIGVVLITRPPFLFEEGSSSSGGSSGLAEEQTIESNYDVWGPVAALSSTLFGANAYVLLRALKGLHFSVIMTNFGAFALVYTLIVCYYLGALCWPLCGSDRMLVIALALFSFGGQILLTLALQYEQAGPVAIARSADIVFAFIWQIMFFKETPNVYSVLGALLVVSSVVLSGMRKWALALPRDSDLRKRLKFLFLE